MPIPPSPSYGPGPLALPAGPGWLCGRLEEAPRRAAGFSPLVFWEMEKSELDPFQSPLSCSLPPGWLLPEEARRG